MAPRLLTGNESLGMAAIAAGVNVVCGYPGTPSTEVLETVAANNPDGQIHVEWSTNEKAALELAAGASYCGARCLVTMKQVGLNVATDPLMSLRYIGVKGGLVLLVADDPGPISSQTEQDTRRFASYSKVPVLDPSTTQEAYEMMLEAFEVSERFETPVIVRPTTRISHGGGAIEPADPSEYVPHRIEGFERDPKWVIFPKRSLAGHRKILADGPAIIESFSRSEFNSVVEMRIGGSGAAAGGAAGARIGVSGGVAGSAARTQAGGSGAAPGGAVGGQASPTVGLAAGGVTYAYMMEALSRPEDLGISPDGPGVQVRVLKVGTPYPFPDTLARSFLEGLDNVLCLEELDSVIEDGLISVSGRYHLGTSVSGRWDGIANAAGENSADTAIADIRRFLELLGPAEAMESAKGAGFAELTELADAAEFAEPTGHADTAACADPGEPAGAAGPVGAKGPEEATEPAGATSSAEHPPSETDGAHPTPTDSELAASLPPRPPVLCAGCPHRGAFYAVKRATKGRKAYYSGDIGCYTLGNAMPLDMVDNCLCMGAGITMAQGMKAAEPDALSLAFVGDSTFFASGITGVVNAVYNGNDINLMVLDNSTTAMTGHQPHPGTGVRMSARADGVMRVEPISIRKVLEAVGVSPVLECDPNDLEDSMECVRRATESPGTSAVIFKSPCVAITRSGKTARIDQEKCTRCRKCIREIGCPALSVADGVVSIDATQCNGCSLCAQVCPFDSVVVEEVAR